MIRPRVSLPIDSALPQILASLESTSNLVLQADPGAGKTTRLPPALLRAKFIGTREVWVLEPRRLAAKLSAMRVAEELGERVGVQVGYQFRYERVGGPETRLRFLTEGMLMRLCLEDPELKHVGAVVLDEFHERHLQADVALAALRALQKGARPDLRLVVMSATLDGDAIARYLGEAPVIKVPGRNFEVQTQYLPRPPGDRALELVVRDGVQQVYAELRKTPGPAGAGHILVFLPGLAEIRRAESALRDWANAAGGVQVLPLHGELDRVEQERALGPATGTKVILSTNVAETSLTIEGVRAVVDSGLARVASHLPWSGLPTLRTRPVSRASAIQRAGRAGRTAPGICLRLYTKGEFDGRAPFDVPEIARADLAQVRLETVSLQKRGVSPAGWNWFEAPATSAWDAAGLLLFKLGALTAAGELSPIGERLARLPLHPRLGRLILAAQVLGIAAEGVRAAAMIAELRPDRVDFSEWMQRAGNEPLVRRMEDRLRSALGSTAIAGPVPLPSGATGGGASVSRDDRLAQALLRAFPDRVGKRRAAVSSIAQTAVEILMSSGGTALLEDAALAQSAEYFVAIDAEERTGLGRAQAKIRAAVAIVPEWLFDLEPSALQEEDSFEFDSERGRLESSSRLRYDALVLSDEKQTRPDGEKLARAWVDVLWGPVDRATTLHELWDSSQLAKIVDRDEFELFWQRLRFAAENAAAVGLSDFAKPDLAWLRERLLGFTRAAGVNAITDLRDQRWLDYLASELPAPVTRALEQGLPADVALGRGRRAKIHYDEGKPPWIESRLQDFIGMREGPKILGGKVSLVLHLLAPNYRAVQVTADLAGFWQRVYPELRRELGRRYPRHPWPEDPLKPLVEVEKRR